jgi:hypothetical protein
MLWAKISGIGCFSTLAARDTLVKSMHLMLQYYDKTLRRAQGVCPTGSPHRFNNMSWAKISGIGCFRTLAARDTLVKSMHLMLQYYDKPL